MDVRVFRVRTAAEARQLRSDLHDLTIDASVAQRAGNPYVAVWSDRADVPELVRALAPTAVSVNLDHVPLPAAAKRPSLPDRASPSPAVHPSLTARPPEVTRPRHTP